ncbi:hypothetical protein [Aneurinibacillus migulanus]|nr:hypothetical protein [Aneurinibacillus migulanus]MED0890849.1 hypothetical protein [Aneurinibacillus migulanus]MED1618416.1 hypothetical protein [Aneurinibacillus migulanus]
MKLRMGVGKESKRLIHRIETLCEEDMTDIRGTKPEIDALYC